MKRRDLIDTIGRAAANENMRWILQRHGADHDVFSLDGMPVVVPRHRVLKEFTALGILKKCEAKLGRKWWT